MRKTLKMMAFVIVAVLALSIAAPAITQTTAYAATKTVKANKKYKKSKSIKKGASVVKCAKGKSQTPYYVKFKAPKKGKYTFTFTNYDDGGAVGSAASNCGYFAIYTKRSGMLMLAYKAGSKNSFAMSSGMTSNEQVNYYKTLGMDPLNPAKNTLKVKLKKGQTIYIASIFTNSNAYKYTVKVK